MWDWAHSRRLRTPADEAGSVVLRQPPASKLASLFRIEFAVWWVAPPWPILSVLAVLLALCRLVDLQAFVSQPLDSVADLAELPALEQLVADAQTNHARILLQGGSNPATDT